MPDSEPEPYRVRKLKQDICKAAGHASRKDLRCTRCNELDIESSLREHCDKFIGLKATEDTYDAIRADVSVFLQEKVVLGDLLAWESTEVVQQPFGIKISSVITITSDAFTKYYIEVVLT